VLLLRLHHEQGLTVLANLPILGKVVAAQAEMRPIRQRSRMPHVSPSS
jgi:hypothetical protein